MTDAAQRDPLPDTFATIDEVIEFWDTHSTADYPEAFSDVKVLTGPRRSHFFLEVPRDVMHALIAEARERDTTSQELAAELLREQLSLSQPVAA